MDPIKFNEPELNTFRGWAEQSLPKAIPMIEDIKRNNGVYTSHEGLLLRVETAFDALTNLRETVLTGGSFNRTENTRTASAR